MIYSIDPSVSNNLLSSFGGGCFSTLLYVLIVNSVLRIHMYATVPLLVRHHFLRRDLVVRHPMRILENIGVV